MSATPNFPRPHQHHENYAELCTSTMARLGWAMARAGDSRMECPGNGTKNETNGRFRAKRCQPRQAKRQPRREPGETSPLSPRGRLTRVAMGRRKMEWHEWAAGRHVWAMWVHADRRRKARGSQV